jgi:hypothetical protein
MMLEHNTPIEISNPIESYCRILLDPTLQIRLEDRLQNSDRFCIASHRIRYRIESPGLLLKKDSVHAAHDDKQLQRINWTCSFQFNMMEILTTIIFTEKKQYMHIDDNISHAFISYHPLQIWYLTNIPWDIIPSTCNLFFVSLYDYKYEDVIAIFPSLLWDRNIFLAFIDRRHVNGSFARH